MRSFIKIVFCLCLLSFPNFPGYLWLRFETIMYEETMVTNPEIFVWFGQNSFKVVLYDDQIKSVSGSMHLANPMTYFVTNAIVSKSSTFL